jgi:hypothetical protein
MNYLDNTDNIKKFTEQNDKKYVPMDLKQISNILVQKMNSIKSLDDTLIDEICNGLKLYCQHHNEMINDWFDENYVNDLKTLKTNNKNYLELSASFSSNSFVLIPNFN